MRTNTKSAWKTKKISSSKIIKGNPNIVVEKKATSEWEPNVSIFTKTTSPKVIIQSENIKYEDNSLYRDKHKIIKTTCMVIMCIILLMTFFISLQTYNTINELSQYIHQTTQP